ncbi:MAG TPA: VWA domain-containing protein [Candidatus Binatia bacterium]|nr:VWA domain-containing protein [Candidatus Binatia bacterium]
MKRLFSSGLALLLLSCFGFGNPQDAPDTQATFTSNSELVLVPVQVMDRWERPLHGLGQQEFVLKSDGTPQRIALFEEMQASPQPAAQPAARPSGGAAKAQEFSNLPSGGLPEHMLILAIDTVNTPIQLQGWARNQLIRYLQTNPPRQPLALVAITSGGLRQIHPFSTDVASLIASIRQMRTQFTHHEMEEVAIPHISADGTLVSYASLMAAIQQVQPTNTAGGANGALVTLRSFEELAWAYSGVPGRKTVMWFTTGFPIVQEVPDGPALMGRGGVPQMRGWHLSGELLPEFQRAFTALNRANVVVYPVDVKGLPLEAMWDASQPAQLFIHPEQAHLYLAPPDASGAERDGMKELARRTGGKSCTANNNVTSCISEALTESADYYLLGFYVPKQQRKPGWHKLKVSVNVNHGEVRARSTYYLRPPGQPPLQEQQDDLRSAIHAGVEYTGIIFSVEPGQRGAGTNTPIPFRVSVPASSVLLMPGQEKLSFDVIAIPLSASGDPLGTKSRIVNLDMPPKIAQKALQQGWKLIDSTPGGSTIAAVKVIVRDNETGRVGSVVFPVADSRAPALSKR